MDTTSRGMVDKIRKLFEGDVDTLDVLCIVVKASGRLLVVLFTSFSYKLTIVVHAHLPSFWRYVIFHLLT